MSFFVTFFYFCNGTFFVIDSVKAILKVFQNLTTNAPVVVNQIVDVVHTKINLLTFSQIRVNKE
jgi:hypothetical protein